MAQQILNVSTPNSGLGDALRDASIKSNDNFTELYNNKVDKVTGKDLSDNNLTDELIEKINDIEALAQKNVQDDWLQNDVLADDYIKNKPEQLFASLGYFDYADLATQTTPITVASGVETLLTNDTLGDATNTSQPPYGVNAIWDADSDEFNFQQLSVGDTVDIRVHLKTTTTSANQKYHIDMKFAFDGPSEFENRVFSQYVKTASEDEQTFITTLYIGSEDVKNYPARLYITSDDDATVEVVGWFCRVFRKSVNVVDIITDEAPIDGLTYGRKDAEWVEVSGGGSVGTLQQVTDNGNTTTNDITAGGFLSLGNANIPAINFNDAGDLDTSLGFLGADPSITTPRNWELPDASGTIALTSDIPTELSELNEDATHRLVTGAQISTWDSLVGGTVFQTVWNASTNTPTLTSSTGTAGHYYIVNVDGTTNLDGINDWKIGDWAIFDGTVWRKVDNTDAISSFNGRTGAITLLDTDVLPLLLSGLSAASGTFTSSDTTLTAFGKIKYLIDNIASTYQAALTDVNFGSFSNGLTGKTTPVDADSVNIVDSADSNKAKKVSLTNFKAFLKTYFDSLYSVPCITITTSSSIDTDSTSSGYGQHGRNTKIANSTNAINLTVQTTSNADFVASYTKIGSATITFVAGSGATLVQLSGTASLTGTAGSTACLTRNGNTYYLQITNY